MPETSAKVSNDPRARSYALRITEPEGFAGQSFELTGDEVVIGRDKFCDFCIKALSVNRWHAKLVPTDGSWMLTDLESCFGTFLNGRKMDRGGRAPLSPGDRIGLGRRHGPGRDLVLTFVTGEPG